MGIGSAGKAAGKPIVTPAHKVGSRNSDEVKFTERPTTQQKSSIQKEQEEHDELVKEVVDKVHKEENEYHRQLLSNMTRTNKLFKSVLQVHRIEITEVEPNVFRERYIPQGKLVFDTDDDFYAWATRGGFDKDLNDDFDYVVLRRILTNKDI